MAAQEDGLMVGVLVRVVVFVTMTSVIIQMRQGKNWTRITLGVVLGLFGTLSLMIGPIEWLAQEHSLTETLTGLTESPLFTVSRIVHIMAVLTGLILMFLPASNCYFKQLA